MLAQTRRFIGSLWGHTTTQLLALLVAVQPVIGATDPTLISSVGWLRWMPLGIACGIAVLRVVCPPPPSIPVQPEDRVHIDADNGTIAISKPDISTVPAAVQNIATTT